MNNHGLNDLNDESTFASFRIDESHLFSVEVANDHSISDSSAGTSSEDETLFSTTSFSGGDGSHPTNAQRYILDNNCMFVPLKSSSHSFHQHCLQRGRSQFLSSFSPSNDLSRDTENDFGNTSTIKSVRRYKRINSNDEERSLLSKQNFINCGQQQLNTSKTFSCMSFRRQSQPCNDQKGSTCVGFLFKRSRSGKLVPSEIYLMPRSQSLDHNQSLLTSDSNLQHWKRSENDFSACGLYGTIFDDDKNDLSTLFEESLDSYVDYQYQDDDTYFFQIWDSDQTSNSLLLRSDENEISHRRGFEDGYNDAELSGYSLKNSCNTKSRNKNQKKRKLFQQCFKHQDNKHSVKAKSGNNVQTEINDERHEEDILEIELIQQQIHRAYNNLMSIFNGDYAIVEEEAEKENKDNMERRNIFWMRLKRHRKSYDKSFASLTHEERNIRKQRGDACAHSLLQRKTKDITSPEESVDCGKVTGIQSETCADALLFRRNMESTVHVSPQFCWMDGFLKDKEKDSKLVDEKQIDCNSKIKRFEKWRPKKVEMKKSQECFVDEENFFLGRLEQIFLGPDSN